MRRTRPDSICASLLLAVFLLEAGCATVQSESKRASKTTAAPAASPSSNAASALLRRSAGDPGAAADASPAQDPSDEETIREARALYELGAQYYERGEMAAARSSFDGAIERLTSGKKGARQNPALTDAYEELLRDIQSLETASYQSGSGLSPEDPIPIELLDEIEPEISPEQAARERQLVQSAEVPSDLPMVVNDKVLAWIGIYQGSLHDRFQEGLVRSGKYLPMIRRIFREEGIPEDLGYMAHVESAYKPYAYSRARAKGVWQFIAETGTRYGLRRSYWVDERSDPELATRAAAAYLKDLYAMFGDWYLAMAAYNAGEGKIQRAVSRTGQTDFWAIARTSQIRLETKNYVPAILAAILISKNPEKFGFTTEKDPPVVYDVVQIQSATDLNVVARLSGAETADLLELNPALTRTMTPPGYPDFELHLPVGTGTTFTAAYAVLPESERIPWRSHTVSRGETLTAISRRYGVPVSQIRAANGLGSSARLKIGMNLQIPTYAASPTRGHGDITRARSSYSRGGPSVIRVRNGDTLSSIASRYRVSVQNLKDWNNLSSSRIRAGQRLVVRKGGGHNSGTATAGSSKSAKSSTAIASAAGSGGSSKSDGQARTTSSTYKVKRGDTLYKIATRLSTTVEMICRVNKISSDDPIMPGMLLKIER